MKQKQEKQIYIEIVKILKILSHIVSYDERSMEQYKKYDEFNNNINNSYKYMIKMLEDNKYNMYILNSYEICNMIKDILYIYDKNIECIICKVKSAYNLKTTYLKIKILDKWYNLDFANCIYELRANTRPLFFLINDDVMQRLQNISYETESIEKYMKECISLYNFEDVLDEKYNIRDNNIKTLAFKKIEWPYPEYHNIYEKILLKPLDYFLSSSLDTYDDLKELIGILKEKYLYNVYDVIQKEVFFKKKYANCPLLKVKENYYDILEYIYLEEEKKQSLEDRSVFISFKDHNNMEENIEEILKDKYKKEQLLKYLDKIAHIQFKIYSIKNYTIGMLDIFKRDNKNRNIDISIYIQNFDMLEKNIYVFEKALKEIDDIYLKISEKTDKMHKKDSNKYDYTYYYTINIYDYLIHNMIYDASDIEDTEIPYIFRDRFAKIIKNEEQGIDRILYKYGTCGTFTNIIGVLLDKKDIPNAKIIGTLKDTAHVWNQVQIQGKWYNLDYINDINNIYDNIPLTKFLLSNQEFKDYKIFYTLQNGNGVQLQDVHLPNICTNNFINENINENEHEHENKVIIKYDFNNTVDYYKNIINVEKLIRRREDILFKIYYKEISLNKFLKYIKLNKELKYRYIIYINLKEIKKLLELEQKEIKKILEILKQNIYYIAHIIVDLKDIKLQNKNSDKIKMIEDDIKEIIEFSNVYVDIPQSLLIKDSEDIQIIIDNKY